MWIDPKTKDAIWRGTSMNGIYLIGEGEYGRIMKAMDRQEHDIKGVTAGLLHSGVPHSVATAPSRCHWTSCVAR